MNWARAFKHATSSPSAAARLFSAETMTRLQAAIASGEAAHRGEVRLVVESRLPLRKIRRDMSTRQRAIDVFGTFRVWDTEENNGVLLYVNVADRRLEIVADRAAARLIGDPHWQTIATAAQAAFRDGDFERGATQAIDAINRALATAFPADPGTARRNELDDQPVVL